MRAAFAVAALAVACIATPAAAQAAEPAAIEPALAACGVVPARIDSVVDSALGVTEVTVTGDAPLDDATLECIARVEAEAGYSLHLFFDDIDLAGRYAEIAEAQKDVRARSAGRAWLAQRGLLDALPVFDPAGQTLADYAVGVETLCRATPGTLIAGPDASYLTLSPAAIDTPVDEEVFMCLASAVAASNLAEQGIFFGFVDN